MTFNPEGFADIKDKYFLLNGRSYPDTVRTTRYVDPNAIGPIPPLPMLDSRQFPMPFTHSPPMAWLVHHNR